MKITRFEIDTNYLKEERLKLYFEKEVTGTNAVYDALIRKIGVTWYDYIFTNIKYLKLSGIDLLLTDSNYIAHQPGKRTEYTLAGLAKRLLLDGQMSEECARFLIVCDSDRKPAQNASFEPVISPRMR